MGFTLCRINSSLDEFVLSWNNHSIRSACHKTPQQLYTAWCLLLRTSNIDSLDSSDDVDNYYGIDPSNVSAAQDSESVVILNNPVKFSETDLYTLQLNVNPLSANDNYGVYFYEQTLQIISTFNQI